MASRPARGSVALAGGLIVLAVAAAYHNSFSGPFVFDDFPSITENPSLRHLWPPGGWMHPPASAGVGGRPVLNFSFALNFALSGLNVWSYHALNLLIHGLGALALFGTARRTLVRSGTEGLRADAAPLALFIALVWALDPVQTASVTYLSQRAESLMGLFYLLTLYGFVRYAEAGEPAAGGGGGAGKGRGLWLGVSCLACALGMGTKEVMVTAPVLVLVYDRVFVGGGWVEIWRKRGWCHGALACTWAIPVRLMGGLGGRGAGYGLGFTAWSYARMECRVVEHYLRLSVWPRPLVFDYGLSPAAGPFGGAVAGLVVLVGVTAACFMRWPKAGYAGVWFFAVLGPTSSVVPVAYAPMAENRLYLPLAGVAVLVVLGVNALLGRRGWVVLAAVAVGWGVLTERRNEDYRSVIALWSDTVAKCPGNAGAHNNLGSALMGCPDRRAEAIAEFREAARLTPNDPGAHNNLGNALETLPDGSAEAVVEYRAALRLVPDSVIIHRNLAKALSRVPGGLSEAIDHYEAALRFDPGDFKTCNNLGRALAKVPGRLPEAVEAYRAALRLNPEYAAAHNNLGNALMEMNRVPEAIEAYRAALRLDPGNSEPHFNLGMALARAGRTAEAVDQLRGVLRADPANARARSLLLQLDPPQR